MRSRTLVELRGNDVPAGPIVEVVTGADRILAGVICEQVSLQGRGRRKHGIIDAQHRGVARTTEGVGIGPADCPLANHLGGACKHGVAGAFIEGLLDRSYFASNPLVEGVQLEIAEAVVEVVAD